MSTASGITDPKIKAFSSRWQTYLDRIDAWVPDSISDWPDDMFHGHAAGCEWVGTAETHDAFAVLDFVLTHSADDLRRIASHGSELWVTDGTAAGTRFIALEKGAKPDYMVGFFHGAAQILSQELARRGGSLP